MALAIRSIVNAGPGFAVIHGTDLPTDPVVLIVGAPTPTARARAISDTSVSFEVSDGVQPGTYTVELRSMAGGPTTTFAAFLCGNAIPLCVLRAGTSTVGGGHEGGGIAATKRVFRVRINPPLLRNPSIVIATLRHQPGGWNHPDCFAFSTDDLRADGFRCTIVRVDDGALYNAWDQDLQIDWIALEGVPGQTFDPTSGR
jgi:hypothetical protein